MSPVLVRVFIVILTINFILIHLVNADKCKKTIRNAFFERCHANRNKRSDEFQSEIETLHRRHHLSKRQIMSIREIFVSSRVPIYHMPYPSYTRHEYTPVVPPMTRVESLPQESHSEVGFEMSYEEMIELFDELYERIPRGTTRTREEMQKKFLPFIEECCKNVELCRLKKDCPWI